MLINMRLANQLDNDGESLLHVAARTGCFQLAKLLVDGGATTGICNRDYEIPLRVAIEANCTDVLPLLVSHASIEERASFLAFAAGVSSFSTCKALVDAGCGVNGLWGGVSGLEFAIRRSDCEIAKLLIDGGCSLGQPGRSSLLCKAINGEHIAIIRAMLDAGARVGVYEEFEAARCLDPLTVDFLVDVGLLDLRKNPLVFQRELLVGNETQRARIIRNHPDMIDFQVPGGNTLLLRELKSMPNHFKFANELISLGSNVDIVDDELTSALHIVSSRPRCHNILTRIAQRSKRVNWLDRTGSTPLMNAVLGGAVRNVRGLLAAGANPNQRLFMIGFPLVEFPIIYAAAGGFLFYCADELIKGGASVNVCTTDGTTALMRAAAECRLGVVKLLLAAGADTTLVNSDGKTAYDLMRAYNPGSKSAARRRRHLLTVLGKEIRRRRWQRAVTLATIVSYWSRITVEPDGKLFNRLCLKYTDW